jgi:hypothetical protein
MRKQRMAEAAAVMERLERQSVTLERLDVLTEKAARLLAAGVTHDDIVARRDQINSLAGEGVQYDFNDALLILYDETFAPGSGREEG